MLRAGDHNSITDVPGIEVGQIEDERALTGVTVLLARSGAVAGVDVRGAAPGTRETDLLDPVNLVQRVQAVVLAGGSAYGLEATGGVMRYLEEHGLGQPVGGGRVVPIVPAAVIYDLEVGSGDVRPSARDGYEAATAAHGGPVAQGNTGAGTGARVGGLKGGVGSASSVLSTGWTVGALAIVNALGRSHDPITGELYALDHGLPGEFPVSAGAARVESTPDYGALFERALGAGNTTIGVVATNARLDKAQASKVAQAAHDGLARAIRPAHTMFDGDTIFALSTGEGESVGPGELSLLAAVAADTFARAVVHGVLSANSAGGLRSYCDTYPELCGRIE